MKTELNLPEFRIVSGGEIKPGALLVIASYRGSESTGATNEVSRIQWGIVENVNNRGGVNGWLPVFDVCRAVADSQWQATPVRRGRDVDVLIRARAEIEATLVAKILTGTNGVLPLNDTTAYDTSKDGPSAN